MVRDVCFRVSWSRDYTALEQIGTLRLPGRRHRRQRQRISYADWLAGWLAGWLVGTEVVDPLSAAGTTP